MPWCTSSVPNRAAYPARKYIQI
uniref:Uncharacterized protein n=1 Tax=Rhizophora mucronata TaxID=61149 RepID=A0A2P2N739_RHIMU